MYKVAHSSVSILESDLLQTVEVKPDLGQKRTLQRDEDEQFVRWGALHGSLGTLDSPSDASVHSMQMFAQTHCIDDAQLSPVSRYLLNSSEA